MTNPTTVRTYPSSSFFTDSIYAKSISIAWINWELNQLEERAQIQKRKSKK